MFLASFTHLFLTQREALGLLFSHLLQIAKEHCWIFPFTQPVAFGFLATKKKLELVLSVFLYLSSVMTLKTIFYSFSTCLYLAL